jgi:hypothetical protein
MTTDRPSPKPPRHDEHLLEEKLEERIGTHPLASTAGAAGGAVAGAIIGIAAGPLGSLAGAVGGAVLGGMLGSSTGSGPVLDTSEDEAYWREHYASRPYVASGATYDDYEPAYLYGIHRYMQSDRPREWSEVEPEMQAGWDDARAGSRLNWEQAREAVRDAWVRMHDNRPAELP